jgi:hypothetical protein
MATDEKAWVPLPVKLVLGTEGHAGSLYSDFSDVLNTWYWIMVLAAPPLHGTLKRAVDPAHLVRLMDIYIAYAARGTKYLKADFAPVAWEQRAPLARKLRALLVDWTPPGLPIEITEAARELLHAEGQKPPEGGWDALRDSGPEAVEDILLWPEGVPAMLKRGGDGS